MLILINWTSSLQFILETSQLYEFYVMFVSSCTNKNNMHLIQEDNNNWFEVIGADSLQN